MSLLHDHFYTRNLQAFQRLLAGDAAGQSNGGTIGGGGGGPSGSSERGGNGASVGASPSSGGGTRSWTRSSGLSGSWHDPQHPSQRSTSGFNPNVRDAYGRTPLHLACASLESIEYVRALLKHPQIDVNALDGESHWSPLHRALYAANLPAALLLLQRSDIDISLKDLEGYTAFDLYNSTLHHTKPDSSRMLAELYTWGANRNAALGVGDGSDRAYPEHIVIKHKDEPEELEKKTLSARFTPIHVRQVQMSKLHTVVVTDEPEANLRLCGFGSGGRLGPSSHQQYTLKPFPHLNQRVVAVAVGQDHTLALTRNGEVYSWGLNRFSQLGYTIELPPNAVARHEEPIQAVPKRVVGLLRREVVVGVAASKNASACWTADTIYTWGTNVGQLGYDKAAQPVQVSPRPITKFSSNVIDVALSETVLCALLDTKNVECLWNDRHFRISFPVHAFPSGIQPYRPPQAVKDSRISKVTSCGDTFAALSQNGEVFTFSAPTSSSTTEGEARSLIKPQRVWALRKKFRSVRDVALGVDGSLIICTESGHVFTRARNATNASNATSFVDGNSGKYNKSFKFERVPYLQRISHVAANSTGAFAALKVGYVPPKIDVVGNTLAQDLRAMQPYLVFYQPPPKVVVQGRQLLGWDGLALQTDQGEIQTNHAQDQQTRKRTRSASAADAFQDEDVEEDGGVEADVRDLVRFCQLLRDEKKARKTLKWDGVRLPFDANCLVEVLPLGIILPAHSVILSGRSDVLQAVLSAGAGHELKHAKGGISVTSLPAKAGPGLGVNQLARIAFRGCSPLTILILLRYFYSDDLLAVWDHRIGMSPLVERYIGWAGLDGAGHSRLGQIKTELNALSELLDLPAMAKVLEAPVKRTPDPTLADDMTTLFEKINASPGSLPVSSLDLKHPLRPDVVLEFANGKEVWTHSLLLRARSPFFASLFGLEDWTLRRRSDDGVLRVNLRHMQWDAVRFVVRFMCCGRDEEMFSHLEFVKSVEDLLAFMFEVMGGANELLLDRMVLICSSVILQYTNIHNACYVLAEATHYHALPLIERLQDFLSVNLESFLESNLLSDLPHVLVKQLSFYIKTKQTEKTPFSRSNALFESLTQKHARWLEEEDFPKPIPPAARITKLRRDAAWASKPGKTWATNTPLDQKPTHDDKETTPGPSTPQRLRRVPSGDTVFVMDELDSGQAVAPMTPISSNTSLPAVPSPPVWRSMSTPKVDMKAVLEAEARSARPPGVGTPTSTPSHVTTGSPSLPRRVSGPPSNETNRPGPSTGQMTTAPGWRVPQPPRPTAAPSSSTTRVVVPGTPPGPTLAEANRATSSSKTAVTPSKQQPTPSLPGLGPVIVPSREREPSASTSKSSNKAWTLPPLEAPKPSSTPLPSNTGANGKGKSSGMSFLEIQQSQQQATPTKEPKRSLKEIQQEEAELQAEVDFMKWWTAEEERLREEERRTLALIEQHSRGATPSTNRGRGGGGASKNAGRPKQSKKAGRNPHTDALVEAEVQVGGSRNPQTTGSAPPSSRASADGAAPHKPRQRRPPRHPHPNQSTQTPGPAPVKTS